MVVDFQSEGICAEVDSSWVRNSIDEHCLCLSLIDTNNHGHAMLILDDIYTYFLMTQVFKTETEELRVRLGAKYGKMSATELVHMILEKKKVSFVIEHSWI